MNNLIVNIVFGTLTIIFLIGIVIMIMNAVKIKTFSGRLKKKLKEESHIKIAYLRSEWKDKAIACTRYEPQNKLISIISKPILRLPSSAQSIRLIN